LYTRQCTTYTGERHINTPEKYHHRVRISRAAVSLQSLSHVLRLPRTKWDSARESEVSGRAPHVLLGREGATPLSAWYISACTALCRLRTSLR